MWCGVERPSQSLWVRENILFISKTRQILKLLYLNHPALEQRVVSIDLDVKHCS